MTLFVISEHHGAWSVSRLSETTMVTASGIRTEAEALVHAMQQARENSPSRVLSVSSSGHTKVLAKFESSQGAV